MSSQSASAPPDDHLGEVERCPGCGARRHSGQDWCGQCLHRFEPAVPARRAEAGSPEQVEAELQADLTDWDARYRQVAAELDEDERAARTEQAMSQLGSPSAPTERSPLLAFLATPLGKALVIGGGTLALLGAGLLLMWVLGHLL